MSIYYNKRIYMKRVISGIILLLLAIFVIFLPNTIPLTCLVGLLAVWGLSELYKNVSLMGCKPIWWLGIATTIVFLVGSVFSHTYDLIMPELTEKIIPEINNTFSFYGFSYAIPNENEMDVISLIPAIITLLIFIGFLVEFFRGERHPVKNIGATLFGTIYIGWLLSHIASLRIIDGTTTFFGHEIALGSALVMLMVVCTCATDTFAFFVGKRFGKHKISPKSSPNKTWEGSIGGWCACVVFGCLWGYAASLPMIHVIVISVICGVLSQLGDLTESSIKREIGIKDFSNVIPGHGGVLDRIDSMLFTAPFIYYYVITFMSMLN